MSLAERCDRHGELQRHTEALCYGDMAVLLGEIADEGRRAAIWRSEYQANRIDEQNPDTQAELREWEGTLADGLD